MRHPAIPLAPAPDPWARAVHCASEAIPVSARFEDELLACTHPYQALTGILHRVREFGPALDVANGLKATQLPLVDNAWSLVKEAANTSAPSAGEGLQMTVDAMEHTLDLEAGLRRLHEVEAMASAASPNRNSSSQENLRDLSVPAITDAAREIASLKRKAGSPCGNWLPNVTPCAPASIRCWRRCMQ